MLLHLNSRGKVVREVSSRTEVVEVPVRVTPSLGKFSGDYWSFPFSEGFPWPGCWLLWVCPNLCLEIPEAHFSVPYFRFSQAQKIQSPGFGWVVFLCEQNGTQFAQCWCKRQPQIISARGQLIISLAPGGNMPRHFCSSKAITFALYLHWMFKYFCIPVTVSLNSS